MEPVPTAASQPAGDQPAGDKSSQMKLPRLRRSGQRDSQSNCLASYGPLYFQTRWEHSLYSNNETPHCTIQPALHAQRPLPRVRVSLAPSLPQPWQTQPFEGLGGRVTVTPQAPLPSECGPERDSAGDMAWTYMGGFCKILTGEQAARGFPLLRQLGGCRHICFVW